MESVAPPKPAPQQMPRTEEPAETGPAAAGRRRSAAQAPRVDLAPDKLLVQLDQKAGRFVHTLTDADTEETVRRYPSEAQLAYSRAVMAYLRAQIGK